MIRTAVVCVALVATLAACGGGKKAAAPTTIAETTKTTAVTPARTTPTKQAYVARMQALGRTIGNEVNRVFPIDTGTRGSATEASTLTRLEHAKAVFDRVLATVRSMRPPAKVAADQRRLDRGLEGVVAELEATIEAIRTGDLRASIVPSRLADLTVVAAATTSMEKKGFDVLGKRG